MQISIPSIKVCPKYFFLIMAIGTSLATVFHLTLGYFNLSYPWTTFLFNPGDRFNDWHNSIVHAAYFNPYEAPEPAIATYFPFAYVLFKLGIFETRVHSLLVYFSISFGLIFMAAYQAAINSKKKISDTYFLIAGTALSYPAIFAFDRGNIDIWIAFLCAIFIINSQSNSTKFGCICLAIAIALKGYPAAFVLVYLREKKWSYAAVCILLVTALTIIPLYFLWGGFSTNLSGLKKNLELYKSIYVLGSGSLFASSDPFNAVRLIFEVCQSCIQKIIPLPGDWVNVNLHLFSSKLLEIYTYFSFILASICALFALFSSAQEWKRTLSICIICLIFPAVTNDYKLNIIFPALYLLLEYRDRSKSAKIIFALICALLIPKSYYFIDGRSISMLINPILIIAILLLTVCNKNDWKIFAKMSKK